MNTDASKPEAAGDEEVRKIYVKDLKASETVTTVFRAAQKERHQSRNGKPYLSLTLQDRTGEVDARVFEAAETAWAAFQDGDYLLVRAKVGTFHGKTQLVLERLERLDPTPLDPKEFTPPPAPREKEKDVAAKGPGEAGPEAKDARRALRQKLVRLLDDPVVMDGLLAVLRHLEAWKDAPVPGGSEPSRSRRRGPKVDHRPEPTAAQGSGAAEDKSEPKAEPPKPQRDPGLPQKFAFKPFAALTGEPGGSPEGAGQS